MLSLYRNNSSPPPPVNNSASGKHAKGTTGTAEKLTSTPTKYTASKRSYKLVQTPKDIPESDFIQFSGILSPVTSLTTDLTMGLTVNNSNDIKTPRKWLANTFADASKEEPSSMQMSLTSSPKLSSPMSSPTLSPLCESPTLARRKNPFNLAYETAKASKKSFAQPKVPKNPPSKDGNFSAKGFSHWNHRGADVAGPNVFSTLSTNTASSSLASGTLFGKQAARKSKNISSVGNGPGLFNLNQTNHVIKPRPFMMQKSASCADFRHQKMRRTESGRDLRSVRVENCQPMQTSPAPMSDGDSFNFTKNIPHVIGDDSLKRINCDTLSELLSDETTSSKVKIIDCRYPYEYSGGHIPNAVNIYNIDSLEGLLFSSELQQQSEQECIIVLHCEFSIQRAPRMAKHLRNVDRNLNAHCYPNLFYPHVYILEGGFKDFFHNQREMCVGEYIEMKDRRFKSDCDAYYSRQSKVCKLRRYKSEGFLG